MGTLFYMYPVLQYLKTCLWVEYAPYRAGITILKTQALKCREACQVTEHPLPQGDTVPRGTALA